MRDAGAQVRPDHATARRSEGDAPSRCLGNGRKRSISAAPLQNTRQTDLVGSLGLKSDRLLDDAAARDTLFGGLAASGWHTAAVTMRLQVTSGLPIAGGIIGAGGELTWPRPTRATDVLHVVSEVVQIQPSKSKPDRGMVTVRSETRNQHGDVLQLTTVRIVVPRRPAAVGAGA